MNFYTGHKPFVLNGIYAKRELDDNFLHQKSFCITIACSVLDTPGVNSVIVSIPHRAVSLSISKEKIKLQRQVTQHNGEPKYHVELDQFEVDGDALWIEKQKSDHENKKLLNVERYF